MRVDFSRTCTLCQHPYHRAEHCPKMLDTKGNSLNLHSCGCVGFTREDVALLRQEAEDEWNGEDLPTGQALLRLADRIEALLPPS